MPGQDIDGKLFGGRPRVTVLGLIRNGDRILVQQGYDSVKQQTFFRPLGGGVDYGERAEEALRREFMEELGAELSNICLLRVVENIFTLEGLAGHEIIFLFEAELQDRALYDVDKLRAHEHGAGDFDALWKPLADFEAGEILYPPGIEDYLGE
jgi:8-oxo-dGTP pyrophosphatase MutT (NUDIX family)